MSRWTMWKESACRSPLPKREEKSNNETKETKEIKVPLVFFLYYLNMASLRGPAFVILFRTIRRLADEQAAIRIKKKSLSLFSFLLFPIVFRSFVLKSAVNR